MVDSLLVVEAFLDGEGIVHHRDEGNGVCFDLPFGRTSYGCRIGAEGSTLVLTALWHGQVDPDEAGRAQRVSEQLSKIGDSGGRTYFNPARGKLMFTTSVDLSCAALTVERVAPTLEALLDPFNARISAMQLVLDHQLSEDAVVSAYAEWNRKRLAALARPLRDNGGADPARN